MIEDLTKQCEEGPENPHKGRIQSVSEETILLTKLKKTEIEKEKFASVAESFRYTFFFVRTSKFDLRLNVLIQKPLLRLKTFLACSYFLVI